MSGEGRGWGYRGVCVWEERDRERESERERERSLHQYCCTQHSQPHNNTTAHQWNSRTIQQCNGAPLQEGIGIGRLTANFAKAVVSFAMLVSDQVTHATRRFESLLLRAAMCCNVLYCVATFSRVCHVASNERDRTKRAKSTAA